MLKSSREFVEASPRNAGAAMQADGAEASVQATSKRDHGNAAFQGNMQGGQSTHSVQQERPPQASQHPDRKETGEPSR